VRKFPSCRHASVCARSRPWSECKVSVTRSICDDGEAQHGQNHGQATSVVGEQSKQATRVRSDIQKRKVPSMTTPSVSGSPTLTACSVCVCEGRTGCWRAHMVGPMTTCVGAVGTVEWRRAAVSGSSKLAILGLKKGNARTCEHSYPQPHSHHGPLFRHCALHLGSKQWTARPRVLRERSRAVCALGLWV
jgi:hypothetical protein